MALSTLPNGSESFAAPDPSRTALQSGSGSSSERGAPALLVINPAFLQEIKDSNPKYWIALRRLPECCHEFEEPMAACNELTRAIDELRDVVALQFSLEESYGFLEVRRITSARRVRTDLHDKAVQLREDHRRLYLELSELAEAAEELQYRGARPQLLRQLIARSLAFEVSLTRHERDESELIRLSLI